MEIEEVHMSAKDIIVIINVSETIQATTMADLNITAVVNSLGRLDVINTARQQKLLLMFGDDSETSLNTFYAFVRTLSNYVPFFGFTDALKDAGYNDFYHKLIAEKSRSTEVVSRGVLKRDHPNAKALHTYYTCLKKCADNNMFENQTLHVLNQMISSLDIKTCECSDINRLQLLVDKRCVLYFILVQQCCCIPERNVILKRMRDAMPRDVDRTVFDTIFHSCMSFNWAIGGDVKTAERHEKQARITCDSCTDGFVKLVTVLWSQYKNNILYLHSHCRADLHLNQAKADFETIQQCLNEFCEEEQIMWKTISVLDMVRSTVGMHSKFPTLEVCSIKRIDEKNTEYAKILLDLVPVPRDTRRRMYYLVLQGRVHELTDRLQAKKCVEDALTLADDGCYDATEKQNIYTYLKTLLGSGDLPEPSF